MPKKTVLKQWRHSIRINQCRNACSSTTVHNNTCTTSHHDTNSKLHVVNRSECRPAFLQQRNTNGNKPQHCQLRRSITNLKHYWFIDHYFRSVCWFVCLSVCLFVCAEFFSAVFDPISIKLGHMLYVWVYLCPLEYRGYATPGPGWP